MTVFLESIRRHMGFVAALVSIGAGCADGDVSLEESDVGSLSQGIDNGNLVTSNVAPFNSVVRLIAGSPQQICSGLKISATRYLTAAHCVSPPVAPGQRIEVSNALNATDAASVTANQIYIHPSYTADPESSLPGIASHSYDIALVETVGDQTPSIPFLSNAISTSNIHIADGQVGMLVAYGGDAFQANRLLHKQRTGAPGHLPWTAQGRVAFGADVATYTRQILHGQTNDGRQGGDNGDSGGPDLRETTPGSNVWQVMGVTDRATASGADPAQTTAARVNNVRRWLASPQKLNTILDAELGFLLNRGRRQCAAVADGGGTTLFECDGRSQPIDDQYWRLKQVTGTNFFQIENTFTFGCLSASTSSSTVVQVACNSALTDQHWSFGAPGAAKQIKITHRTTAQCLTGQANIFDPMLRTSCSASNQNQDWYFFP